MRILLVEDDPALSTAMCSYLRAKSFTVDSAATLVQARQALASAQYAALLLDRHLPDGDGLALLAQLRTRCERPSVIVLTARDQISDRIQGLDAGADDYLIKPYDPGELLARLRAVSRRAGAARTPLLTLADVQIDLALGQVRRAGVLLALTAKEWALLRVLASRPQQLHTRERLQEALYGFEDEVDSNTLEVFISRLRRKLGHMSIETVRGLGYRLGPAQEPPA